MLQRCHLARPCLHSCHRQNFHLMSHPTKPQHLDQQATLEHRLVHSGNQWQVALRRLRICPNNVHSHRPKHWHDSPKMGGAKRVSPTLRGMGKCRRRKCDIYFLEKTCSIAQFKTNQGKKLFSSRPTKNRYQLTVEGWAFPLINPQPKCSNPQPSRNILRKSQKFAPKNAPRLG